MYSYVHIKNILNNKNKKTLLYLHGGAYVACGAETHGPLITTLSEYSHSDVYFPIYGLAPKNPFPLLVLYKGFARQGFCVFRGGARGDPRRVKVWRN